MRILSDPYDLSDPEYLALYVKRASLVPIELGLAVSLFFIGIGLASHRAAIAALPLLISGFILMARFITKPGISERFVRITQAGGRHAVLKRAVFTEQGFRIFPALQDESETTGVMQMPWDRLDRIEEEAGYVFLLPFPRSPRGVAFPLAALKPEDREAFEELRKRVPLGAKPKEEQPSEADKNEFS